MWGKIGVEQGHVDDIADAIAFLASAGRCDGQRGQDAGHDVRQGGAHTFRTGPPWDLSDS